MFLTGHAAAKENLLTGVAAFGMGQRAQIAEYALLCMFPDGAGVHNDHVRALCGIGDTVTTLAQNATDTLRICLVLLTAVGLNIGGGDGVPFKPISANLIAKSKLFIQFLLADNCCFVIHKESSQYILSQQ